MIVQCTATGEEHGLVNTLANSVRKEDAYKNMKPELKADIEKKEKANAKVIKAKYVNYRNRNARLTKPFCLGPGHPIQMWKFIAGRVYDIPRGLAEEVNSKKPIPRRAGLVSEDGDLLQRGGAPLEKDRDGDIIHEFVGTTI